MNGAIYIMYGYSHDETVYMKSKQIINTFMKKKSSVDFCTIFT